MNTKRIGWAIAIREDTDENFIVVLSSGRTSRSAAIENYCARYRYRRNKRYGYAKTIPVYANEKDLK